MTSAKKDEAKKVVADTPAHEDATVTPETPAHEEVVAEEVVTDLPADIFMRVDLPSEDAKLRVREEPTKDGQIVSLVTHGTALRVLDSKKAGWFHVELLDGTQGFVKKLFVIEMPAPESD